MKAAEVFGRNLKLIRKKSGLKQHHLASQLGVTEATVSKWESGSNIPTNNVLDMLCAVLGVEVASLFATGPIQLSVPEMPRRKPTLREAVEIVNEHSGDLIIKIRSKSRVKNS